MSAPRQSGSTCVELYTARTIRQFLSHTILRRAAPKERPEVRHERQGGRTEKEDGSVGRGGFAGVARRGDGQARRAVPVWREKALGCLSAMGWRGRGGLRAADRRDLAGLYSFLCVSTTSSLVHFPPRPHPYPQSSTVMLHV